MCKHVIVKIETHAHNHKKEDIAAFYKRLFFIEDTPLPMCDNSMHMNVLKDLHMKRWESIGKPHQHLEVKSADFNFGDEILDFWTIEESILTFLPNNARHELKYRDGESKPYTWQLDDSRSYLATVVATEDSNMSFVCMNFLPETSKLDFSQPWDFEVDEGALKKHQATASSASASGATSTPKRKRSVEHLP